LPAFVCLVLRADIRSSRVAFWTCGSQRMAKEMSAEWKVASSFC
jgi:hypothetical protein